jgi:hypothetical protein
MLCIHQDLLFSAATGNNVSKFTTSNNSFRFYDPSYPVEGDTVLANVFLTEISLMNKFDEAVWLKL